MIGTITLIASVPAIVALVNFAKRMGIPARGALALAVVLGVTLNVAQYAWAGNGYWESASAGLMLGLAAAGLYDLIPQPQDPAAAIKELMGGYTDDRADVLEYKIGDTVYAGPANDIVPPGDEIRPITPDVPLVM